MQIKKKRFKIRGIKTKLVLYFSILILLSSITLGYISIQKSSGYITKEAEKSLALLATEVAKITESRVGTQKQTLETLALLDEIKSMDWTKQLPIIQRQVEGTKFLDIAIVGLDGTAHYSNGDTSQLGDREYIKKALNGETNISDVIVSRVTNTIVLMYAAPIERDGKVVGVIIGRRDGNALSEIADDSGYGESGYGYMINSKGTVVAHPDREKVLNQFNPIEESKNDESLKSLSTLFEKILSEKKGISNYSFADNDLYAGYAPIEGTEWVFIITANQVEVLSSIPDLVGIIIKFMICILIISIIFTYLIGNSITNPIIKVVGYSKNIADLDITEDISNKFIKKKDEIGDLARSLQSIINSLRDIIGEISNTSEQVLAASEELTASSQQSASAAEEVSQTLEEISRGATDQAQSTEEGSTKAFSLGKIIEEDQNHIKNLNVASNNVSEVVNDGLKEIDNLSTITEESSNATNEINDVIIKTYDSSSKIGQASNVISTIAQQTNLLALNAAIEAARAGNAGKGFAVVADEIKNLAEKSSISTKEIDAIVNELQFNTQNAVKTMERLSIISKEQSVSVINSKNKYESISKAMKNAEEAVKQLNVSGEEMEKMKNEIIVTLENLSSIAEENSAATQQATASIEEQAASSEEIAGASEGLSTLAQNLQSIITKFKI